MGYDVTRFVCEVDENLMCTICTDVLEKPVHGPNCEHMFCKSCIHEWLAAQRSCPICRQTITTNDLKPVSRIVCNILNGLKAKCKYADFGCSAHVRLEGLEVHEEQCEHDCKRLVPCEQGCGLTLRKGEIKSHNCVRELRIWLLNQQDRINEMQHGNDLMKKDIALTKSEVMLKCAVKSEVNAVKSEVNAVKSEVNAVKSEVKAVKSEVTVAKSEVEPIMSCVQECIRAFWLSTTYTTRWSNSLQVARVSDWDAMIPTPDSISQTGVRSSLNASGCPALATVVLIDNAREGRWPAGLSTLEARKSNRQLYEKYLCKRIPGEQAIVVMAVDNVHMSDDFKLDPGMVIIFKHGVE